MNQPIHRPDYSLLATVESNVGSNAFTDPSKICGVSSLRFDSEEELLWAGNLSGHVTSFYYNYNNYDDYKTMMMAKYTSFHVDHESDTRDVLTCPSGVLSLTKSSLRLSIRRGLTLFNHKSELLKDMRCMSLLPSGLLLMAGQQDKMIELDIERAKHVRITEIGESGCVIMRQNAKFLCHGDPKGKITLRDHNMLHVQREFQTHQSLSDFDVHGNYLVTCGYSERLNSYISDPFLMVYDLRMLKAITPIPMPNFSSTFLRFIPLYASKFCVVTPMGQFQLVDVSESQMIPRFIDNVSLAEGCSITAFDVSASSQAIAFGDDQSFVHLYGASNEVVFNKNSQESEMPDVMMDYTPVPFADPESHKMPLSDYHQFNYLLSNDKLLSDLPAELCVKTYRPTPEIDPEIIDSIKMVGNIGYVQLPAGKKLND